MVGCWVDVWLMDNCGKVALRVDVSETGATDELWLFFMEKVQRLVFTSEDFSWM